MAHLLLGVHVLAASAAPSVDVWYSPLWPLDLATAAAPRPDLFPLLTAPSTAWPELASRTATFKLKMQPLYAKLPDADLAALAAVIKSRGMRTGLEIGGARWTGGRCDAAAQLQYAKQEQKAVTRWMALGGSIDSITTDHALTWDIRHNLAPPACEPPVPMAARIDAVAQVFGSWRSFLGQNSSLGFIESLGYWRETRKWSFSSHFVLKTIALPRQARDKRRKR
jgi:hypothetical protein